MRDRIGEGGGEAEERKKPHKSCRRDVGNGQELGRNRKQRGQERVGSVAADPACVIYREYNSKETGREARGTPG